MSRVAFIDVPHMIRWVNDHGVEDIIGGMASAIEKDFLRWGDFDKTPRVASHSTDGVIELMPTSDGDTYAFKYVNGHPSNPALGLQTVTAFGVLARVDTGYPTLVAEMTVLTALRTAATSVMAASVLARPESRTMAMIGAGSQAEFQALGFRAALGIETVRVWDTDPEAVATLVRNLAGRGLEVVVARDAHDAVAGADIITTCTADKAYATVLTDDMVRPGVHVNAIGGDCPGKTELDRRILERADVFVELTEQTRVEGEIQQMAPDFAVTEMWEVLGGRRPGRQSPEQITVFDSVGFAVEDFSALRYVMDSTTGTDHQQLIDLVVEPADPKDLFGHVVGAGR